MTHFWWLLDFWLTTSLSANNSQVCDAHDSCAFFPFLFLADVVELCALFRRVNAALVGIFRNKSLPHAHTDKQVVHTRDRFRPKQVPNV